MKRLFKEGLITTLIGTALILVSVGMYFTNKSSIVEITGWLSLGLAFLRSKDSLIGINN